MEHLVELITRFMKVFFDAISGTVRAVIVIVSWPAGVLGIAPEYVAAALACVLLLLLWRAMAGQRRQL
jgi:hypothetical protein